MGKPVKLQKKGPKRRKGNGKRNQKPSRKAISLRGGKEGAKLYRQTQNLNEEGESEEGNQKSSSGRN